MAETSIGNVNHLSKSASSPSSSLQIPICKSLIHPEQKLHRNKVNPRSQISGCNPTVVASYLCMQARENITKKCLQCESLGLHYCRLTPIDGWKVADSYKPLSQKNTLQSLRIKQFRDYLLRQLADLKNKIYWKA